MAMADYWAPHLGVGIHIGSDGRIGGGFVILFMLLADCLGLAVTPRRSRAASVHTPFASSSSVSPPVLRRRRSSCSIALAVPVLASCSTSSP